MFEPVLVIDNYDSFTYNVVRYLDELGTHLLVVKNDELTLDQLIALRPRALVVSPGPCSPDQAGVSLAAIRHFSSCIPILGVCLGHQAIGQVFGAKVVRAGSVMHGKTSLLRQDGGVLFKGLPQRFTVTRYHSLLLEATSLPNCLTVNAWVDEAESASSERPAAENTTIMAISHVSLPVYGVQFHPESILSEQGHSLINNFLTYHKLV
ncbi:MAG TPA: aminodeoxychorismate/anthranilate synthase component II [Marinagarivorans sp.]